MSGIRPGEIVSVQGVVEAITDGQVLVKIERPDMDRTQGDVLVLLPLHRVWRCEP